MPHDPSNHARTPIQCPNPACRRPLIWTTNLRSWQAPIKNDGCVICKTPLTYALAPARQILARNTAECMTKKAGNKVQLTHCPFDGSSKLRQVGIEGSNAQECLKCHHILVLRPREDGKFFQWQVLIYGSVMHAASECPMEFQTSLIF